MVPQGGPIQPSSLQKDDPESIQFCNGISTIFYNSYRGLLSGRRMGINQIHVCIFCGTGRHFFKFTSIDMIPIRRAKIGIQLRAICGFVASDGEIPLEILAVSFNDDFSPTGRGNETSVGFTLHDHSCSSNIDEYVPAGQWRQVTLCAGDPQDCRGLSVNTSQPATFLVRGHSSGSGSNRHRYAGYDVMAALTPSSNTNGRARYNTHITSATNYCACGGTLCPHYLRLRATPLFTFVRKGRNPFLDTFATIVGFASACATAGIPLGIILRNIVGNKYASWEYWLNKNHIETEQIPMDSKSPQ
eukprot:jgi/Bigna1/91929/estExt_fgenesh1_pg.C_1310005